MNRARSSRPTRIFAVDDDLEYLELLRGMLERLGHVVESSLDPVASLQALGPGEAPCDILITDLNMPSMNGRELANRLLAIRPELPVLIISNDPDASCGLSPHGRAWPCRLKPITMTDCARLLAHARHTGAQSCAAIERAGHGACAGQPPGAGCPRGVDP